MEKNAFTLIETLAALVVTAVLTALLAGTGWKIYEKSSLAVSAHNIRQLAAGAAAYLGDNNYTFWRYQEAAAMDRPGTIWWFGFETAESKSRPEGRRQFDPGLGPLGGYVPAGVRPDVSFSLGGRAFKPKYQSGYLGLGYNVLLGGGWGGNPALLKKFWSLANPADVVVFFTSAQVNTFQSPASAKNPLLEEFYGLDEREVTVHFRHHGLAMVAYANGAAGFLPMDESARDPRLPKANVGRFAPRNSKKYLE